MIEEIGGVEGVEKEASNQGIQGEVPVWSGEAELPVHRPGRWNGRPLGVVLIRYHHRLALVLHESH